MTAAATPKGQLTQKQIADQLGVSRQLVGFALRGEGRMSDEVRQRILEAARANGYHQYSNREARAMVSRRYGKRAASGVMAVMFQATFEDQPISSVPFYVPFFQGLENEAIKRGVDLVLCPLRPAELPRLIREGQVDGVACLLAPAETLARLRPYSLPLVNVMPGGVVEDTQGAPCLLVDSRRGVGLAVEHLYELGHRRIAYLGLGTPSHSGGRESQFRYEGFAHAMMKLGLPPQDVLMELSLTIPGMQDGADGMRRLLTRCAAAGAGSSDPGFTGLVCFNDLIAMGAVRVLQEAGWRVPEDVSVVGFDDVSLQYSFTPAITSIGFPRLEMGMRAVQLLCEMSQQYLKRKPGAETGTEPRVPIETFPISLVQRESTAPLAVARPMPT